MVLPNDTNLNCCGRNLIGSSRLHYRVRRYTNISTGTDILEITQNSTIRETKSLVTYTSTNQRIFIKEFT